MPNIDFNEFQKQEEEEIGEGKTYTVSRLQTKDTQYYIREEDILFDIIDLDLDGKGPGMEIYMSFLGGDFKMLCSYVSKKEFESPDFSNLLMRLIDEYKPCLLCKTKFLDGFCDGKEDDDDEEA